GFAHVQLEHLQPFRRMFCDHHHALTQIHSWSIIVKDLSNYRIESQTKELYPSQSFQISSISLDSIFLLSMIHPFIMTR
ncbi:hypothetical protein L9F63_007782, partial [Diploptera punctata]